MKNIHLLTALVLITSILGGGCKKDWLDQKPDKNLTVPESLKDYQSLLDNSGLNYSALDIGEIASDGHYLRSEYYQYLDDIEKNSYTWSHERPYLKILNWNQTYNLILTANLVIDGLKKIKPDNQQDQIVWNQLQGNALFTRARLFYGLAQIWTSAYQKGVAEKKLGLPLRLNIDITIPSTRSSLQQTYDQIISDFSSAISLMPDVSPYKTRGSKAAILGGLARAYLAMGEYKKAGDNANASLELYNRLLDFNTLDTSASYIGQNNTEVIFHSIGIPYIPLAYAYIDRELFNSFHSNDLRRKIYFIANPDGTLSFKGNYNNDNMSIFTGLATDELYLVRAECYAREGKTELAMEDLNTLLKSRWSNKVPFPKFTAVDAEDALRQILTERKKELILRGVRWSDLKRLNLDTKYATTLTREADGREYNLEPNSYRYTFPIPDDVIQLSGMQQNEGWEK